MAGSVASALLTVFGDIEVQGRALDASTIYRLLTEERVWLFSRKIAPVPGTQVLFYRVGSGFVGSAVVVAVADDRHNESTALRSFPERMYPYKIHLSAVRTFAHSVDVRPLLPKLSFVRNKTYWGHSFRTSPRMIPASDCRLIIDTANGANV